MRIPAAAITVAFLLSGCAGGRVYESNIRHVCLCAVKTVRANGYVVKEQDFQETAGTLVASFSIPDLKGTQMIGSLTNQAGSFIWNAWEHSKLNTGSRKRVRIEERVTVKFRATGGGLFSWLDWNSRNKTTIDLVADVTDYGKSDWVINRENRPREYRESLFAALAECLAGRQVIASALPKRPETMVVLAESASPKAGETSSVPKRDGTQPVVSSSIPSKTAPMRTNSPLTIVPVVRKNANETVAEPEKLQEGEVKEFMMSARGAYESGNYPGAIERFERVVATDPQNAEALGYLGASYHQMGRNSDAITVYEKYLKLVPGDYRTRQFVEEIKGK